jgi:hypothetical protein
MRAEALCEYSSLRKSFATIPIFLDRKKIHNTSPRF